MKAAGFSQVSHFRLAVIIIVIAILWAWFLNYANSIAVATERASIQQTRNTINSSLLVLFATYAAKGKLDRLNELEGANPFVILAEYQILPASYRGEVDGFSRSEMEPGWYFDRMSKNVIYKSFHNEQVYVYSLVLDYQDINESGRYEAKFDRFKSLVIVKTEES